MIAHMLENATSPYNSMSLFNDKIYIVSPGSELCYVSSYDIQTGALTEIQEYLLSSACFILKTSNGWFLIYPTISTNLLISIPLNFICSTVVPPVAMQEKRYPAALNFISR